MNPFIEEFNNRKNVSQNELKSSFRKHSKNKHPDLGGSDAAFIQLQEQYYEARRYFLDLSQKVEQDTIKTASFKEQAREALFQYLRHYSILDLPFFMVKRQDLRFEKLWQEIRLWSSWYDPVLSQYLTQYHSLFSKKIKVEDRYFVIALKHFKKAFVQFLDYQFYGLKAQARVCLSYIHDSRTYLGRGKNTLYHRCLRDLLIYFKEALES